MIQDGKEINRSELSSPIDVQWEPSMPQVVQTPILGENSTSFDAGTEMSLNCLSDANPAPQYSWRILDKNNRTLADLTHWTSETRDLNSKFFFSKISKFPRFWCSKFWQRIWNVRN